MVNYTDIPFTLINHALEYEPCTTELVKTYKPETNSASFGQVLYCPYDYDKARLIVKKMTDQMILDLDDRLTKSC